MASKWGRQWRIDTAERVGTTVVWTLIPTVPVLASTDLSWAWGWATVGVPAVLSLLKCVAVNLPAPDAAPTASVVNVQSVNPNEPVAVQPNQPRSPFDPMG